MTLATHVKTLFALSRGERYEITLQAINYVAKKCLGSKPLPMPRLVKDLDEYTPIVRTGFGKKACMAGTNQSCNNPRGSFAKARSSCSWLVHVRRMSRKRTT
jgi:hypothetical protein